MTQGFVREARAPFNAMPGRDGQAAVAAFLQFLKGPNALPLLLGFGRQRLLANLEPALARDCRSASMLSPIPAKSTPGRITFEELISGVVNPQPAAR